MTKYLLQNPYAKMSLSAIDTFLSLFFHPQKNPLPCPKKLLLCNGAHLGDCILTTALLPALKEAYPDLKIGMLVGSWSQPIVENHPLIDRTHFVDHWKLNRSSLTLAQKIAHYRKTKKKVLPELSDYDTAVDCYFHFPNNAPLLYQAKIPTRIGFISAGFGPLLTHPHPWPFRQESVVNSFATLLPSLRQSLLKPTLFPHKNSPYNDYCVIHMGTGDPARKWPLEKWKELTAKLKQKLIFTGQGRQEWDDIEEVIANRPSCLNLCNKLNFCELVSIIAGADLLISVETAAGHIASAVDTPSVLLYATYPPTLWAPYSPKATVISMKDGIKQIDVEQVYQNVVRLKSDQTSSHFASF